jgi:hypothetical protein
MFKWLKSLFSKEEVIPTMTAQEVIDRARDRMLCGSAYQNIPEAWGAGIIAANNKPKPKRKPKPKAKAKAKAIIKKKRKTK